MHKLPNTHYSDVIMGIIASQITSLTIVYSIVYSDADQRKHQSSASLAFVRGIHRVPVNSPHKWPVTWKMFPFDDVIMECKRLMPCQNAWSFIVNDHISHIRINFPKLSATCMGHKHYVEDLTTISFLKMTPHRGRLRTRWFFKSACVYASRASGSVQISLHLS